MPKNKKSRLFQIALCSGCLAVLYFSVFKSLVYDWLRIPEIRARLKALPGYSIVDLITLVFKAIALSFLLRPSLLFWLPKSIPFLRLGQTIYDPNFKMRKMSSFQAGLAKEWQSKLKGFNKIRRENSKQWFSMLKTGYPQSCSSGNATQPNLIRFPLKVDNKDLKALILRKSNQLGLGIMPAYPDSINGIRELREEFQGQDFSGGKQTANHLITLPTHPILSQKDKTQIVALVSQITHHDV